MTTNWIRGDTNKIAVTVTDTGEAVVLAGATIEAALVQALGWAALFEKTTADFDVVGNVATCTLAVADTQELEAGPYFVEVQITDAAGQVQSAQGPVLIAGDTIV